jgi:hypothetical protein
VAVIGCFCVDLQGVPLIGGQLRAIYDFNHSVPLQNGNIFCLKWLIKIIKCLTFLSVIFEWVIITLSDE